MKPSEGDIRDLARKAVNIGLKPIKGTHLIFLLDNKKIVVPVSILK